jgi:diguanylate cyclase (GGDEF)-like protein
LYRLVAVLVSLGCPAGYFLLRAIQDPGTPSLGWAAHEIAAHLDVYVYLTLSTTVVLVVLGGILGRKEDELAALSMTDALTGLYNRLYFDSRLGEEVRRCERYGAPLSVVVFDVDRFKRTNDTAGHGAGDLLLRRIGAIVSRDCRSTDFVGVRQGGDEFAILLPHTLASDAVRFAERVRGDIEAAVGVTISAGVAEYPPDAPAAAEFLEAADRALYRAKSAGRNRVVVSQPVAAAPARKAIG